MVLKYTTFIFNIDGFIWNWREVDNEFIKIFDMLLEHNRRVILLTNNSAYSKMHITRKLQEKGLINVEEHHIFTSVDALIHYLYKNNISKVYPIGEYGLLKELEENNIEVSTNTRYVVLGIDRNLTYDKLRTAFNILKDDGVLIHLDNALYWKIGNDIYPITVPVIAYLEKSVGRELNKVFLGKPSRYFKEALLTKFSLQSSTTILISNNKNDMKFASILGVDSMLISSDPDNIIASLENHEKPKHIASDIIFVKDLL